MVCQLFRQEQRWVAMSGSDKALKASKREASPKIRPPSPIRFGGKTAERLSA